MLSMVESMDEGSGLDIKDIDAAMIRPSNNHCAVPCKDSLARERYSGGFHSKIVQGPPFDWVLGKRISMKPVEGVVD